MKPTLRQRFGRVLQAAAVIVGIIMFVPMACNELVTKVDTNTGRKYDLVGREITQENNNERTLNNRWSRIYDFAYYVIGLGVVTGLWTVGKKLNTKVGT